MKIPINPAAPWLAVFAISACLSLSVRADVVLSDNFNDGVIDLSRWDVVLANGLSSVTEQNGRMEIRARGYLVTDASFDPAFQPLTIEGTWTFASIDSGDYFQVLTRTDAQPAGMAGEADYGVEFFVEASLIGPDLIEIFSRGDTAVANVQVISNTLDLVQGDSIHFTITDDGQNLAMTVTEIGDSSSAAAITGQSSSDSPVDKIAFHNRERSGSLAYLDDLTVSSPVPEPSSAALLFSAVLLGLRRRFRADRRSA